MTGRNRPCSASLLAVTLLLAALPAAAGPNVWTSHGPDGVTVRFITVDPTTPTTVYAATEYGGVWKSLDSGVTWRAAHAGLATATVNVLAFDPLWSGTLWAGTDGGGLWKSTDAGETWTQVGAASMTTGQASGQIYAIAIHPTTPTTMWTGTGAGILKTTNGGATWTASGLNGTFVGVVVVNPAAPSTLYAGNFSGLYKSTNGGWTWSPSGTGLPAGGIGDLAIHPAAPSTLFVVATNGVWKSTNGGSTWTQSRNFADAFALAFDPQVPSTIYVTLLGLSSGLFRSVDSGATWSSVSAGLTTARIYAVAVDPTDSQKLYAGASEGGGFFRSVNGTSFTKSIAGLSATAAPAVVALPGASGVVCAGTRYHGIFRSLDAGQSWAVSNNAGFPGIDVYGLAASPTSPNTVYAACLGGVYKSTNACATWSFTSIANGLSDRITSTVAVDPTTANVVYAGTTAGAFRTANGGTSWTAVNSGLPITTPWAFAVDPTAPATVYLGNQQGLWKTTTSGASWSASSAGLTTLDVRALALQPTAPHAVYAGTLGGGLFVSGDAGATWSAIGGLPAGLSSSVRGLAFDPLVPGRMYAATKGGVYVSTDGGLAWQPRPTGMHNTRLEGFAVDVLDPRILYAASYGAGVYTLTQENTCGDGVVDPDEACDDGNLADGDCCSSVCTLESSATVCRPAAGLCDAAEFCTGASPLCPGDTKSTAMCRGAAGSCDVAEQCDGVGTDCPVDAFVAAGTECRGAAGVCDVAEQCTGTSAACPTDGKSTATCRGSAGSCDVAEQCDGASTDCPADAFVAAGTECRGAAGVCDVAEQCTGAGAACPTDTKSTTVCRLAAGPCDTAETCDGVGNACPANAFVPAGTVCRAADGACDVAEQCNGTAAACPANGGLPDTDGDTLCDAVDPCTNVGGGRTFGGTNPAPKLILSKINTETVPGNDHLALTGAFVLPAGVAFGTLNPQVHGARVVLRNRFGAGELDATLPGGVAAGNGTRGWKSSNQGKTWTYTDGTTSPVGGIVSVTLWDRNTQLPGRVEVKVVGEDTTYPVVRGDEPIDAVLTIGGPAQAAAGLCGETAFVPADCSYNSSGRELTCRP